MTPAETRLAETFEGVNKDVSVLPPGTFYLEFKGMRLHGFATDISDDIQWRIAVHEFDRRAGAQTENMDRAPVQTRVTLVFAGHDRLSDGQAFLDAQVFLASLQINPSGLLVHPVLGKRQMTCGGVQGMRLSADFPNVWTLPVTFHEDNLDGSVVGEAGSLAPLAQDATSLVDTVTASVVNYLAASATVGQLTSSATSLVASTLAATDALAPDYKLNVAMADVVSNGELAISALRATSATDPEVGVAITNCELLVSACHALVAAALGASSPLDVWVTPREMSLVEIAQQLYGADALRRLSELEANNEAVRGLLLVPAGTRLSVNLVT